MDDHAEVGTDGSPGPPEASSSGRGYDGGNEATRGTRSWPFFAALAGQAVVCLLAILTLYRGGGTTFFAWLAYPLALGAVTTGCKSCGISSVRWMIAAPVVSVAFVVIAFYFWTRGPDFRGDSLDSTDRSVVGGFGGIFVAGATFFACRFGAALGWAWSEIGLAAGKLRTRR